MPQLAVGVVGAAALGSILGGGKDGGGGGGGGGGGLPYIGTQVRTPAYGIDTGVGPNQALQTTFWRDMSDPANIEFARRFPENLSTLDILQAQSAPNASLFRTAALGRLTSQESQSIGNLRQQLAQRGLSGASFSNNVIGNIQAEFGQQRAQTEFQAAQQEFNMTSQIVAAKNDMVNQALQRNLAELGIASGQNINFQQISSANQIANAQIASAQAIAASQSQGSLIGSLLGFAAFGGGKNSIFGGLGSLGGLFGGGGAASAGGSFLGGGASSGAFSSAASLALLAL